MKHLREIAQQTDNRIFASIHPYEIEPSNIQMVDNKPPLTQEAFNPKIISANDKFKNKNIYMDYPPLLTKEDNLYKSLRSHYYNYENIHNKQLHTYIRDSFPLNYYHWSPSKSEEAGVSKSRLKSQTKILDSAMKAHKTPKGMTVWSGTFHDPRERKNKQGIVRHPAYLSTSIRRIVGETFADIHEDNEVGHLLKIHVPKGNEGAYVGHLNYSKGEHEFILPRNTKMRYLKTDTDNRILYTGREYKQHIHHMEVIPNIMKESFSNILDINNNIVNIEVQDASGTWQMYTKTLNDSRLILSAMKTMKTSFPNSRIRAVDNSGRLIDMIT